MLQVKQLQVARLLRQLHLAWGMFFESIRSFTKMAIVLNNSARFLDITTTKHQALVDGQIDQLESLVSTTMGHHHR